MSTFPDHPPLLGPTYLRNLRIVFEQKEELKNGLLSELKKLSDEELERYFSEDGAALDKDWAELVSTHKKRFHDHFRNTDRLLLDCLAADGFLADYDYWSKSAYFGLAEAFWLAVGLEPNKKLDLMLEKLERRNQRSGFAQTHTLDYIQKRFELFRREFNPRGLGGSVRPSKVFSWIERVGLEVHPDFAKMLRSTYDPVHGIEPPAAQQGTAGIPLSQRERNSLTKVILTMAIDGYGYKPDAAKSPLPKDIADAAAGLGIEISDDTVRKYLQMAAREHLPSGKAD